MGILSRLFGSSNEEAFIRIHPNENSRKLADVAASYLVLSSIGFSRDVDPVLRSPQKKKFVWAFFYGFVVGLGMGYRMSVSEVENAAYLVFQTFLNMTEQDASCAVGIVQSMSGTPEGLKWMTAGKDSADRYTANQSPVPIDCFELARLIRGLD